MSLLICQNKRASRERLEVLGEKDSKTLPLMMLLQDPGQTPFPS